MRRIYINIDWAAFWLRFAAGAVVGLLLGVYCHFEVGTGWLVVAACAGVLGMIVGVAGSRLWVEWYRRVRDDWWYWRW